MGGGAGSTVQKQPNHGIRSAGVGGGEGKNHRVGGCGGRHRRQVVKGEARVKTSQRR